MDADLNEPFDVHLRNAVGDETDGIIRVYGAGSAKFLEVQNRQKWSRLKETKRAGHFEMHMPSLEDSGREAIDLLAACTVSWNLTRDGNEPIECTPETAADIYTRVPVIHRNVREAIHGVAYGYEDEMAAGHFDPLSTGKIPHQEKRRRYDATNMLLAAGDFEAAERKYRTIEMQPWRRREGDSLPCWNGERVKVLFFPLAAGLGDMLLILRYMRALTSMVERVNITAPPALRSLVQKHAPPGVHVFDPKDARAAVRNADAYVNQNFLFFLTGEGYGAAQWVDCGSEPLERGPQPRIGICWSGNVTASYNNLRAVPIERFNPLFQVPGIEWHSLQVGPKAKECPPHVIDRAPEIHDFLDTANVAAGLDLVIACDTSTTNLIGSMGRPVWVLVERDGEVDFRWSLGARMGERSAWFPSARVFRQGNDRKWKKPMQRLAEALAQWRAEWDSAAQRIAA